MELEDSSKSSSEEMDRSNDHEMGTGRFYECVFCKRGFPTAQALGGHMNIHRKDRANNKAKPNFPPSSSTKVVDDDESTYNYSSNPGFLTRGNYYSSTGPEVDNINYNYYHQLYFPSHASCGAKSPPSHVQYSEVLCVENQRDPHLLFGQDWRQRGLSLYTNPLCVHENKDKIENNTEEDVLDLELRLGHYP